MNIFDSYIYLVGSKDEVVQMYVSIGAGHAEVAVEIQTEF